MKSIMLKKRSRDGVVSNYTSLPSPTANFINNSTASSLLSSTRSFTCFSYPEAAVMSPTSTLETRSFFAIRNPFFPDRKPRTGSNKTSGTKHHPWDDKDTKPVGLGIVDALSNEKTDKISSMADHRMVFFASQLKIQIPSNRKSSALPTHSPVEFGVNNKNSQLAMALRNIPSREPSLQAFRLSASEMDLSEDYTCVISRGQHRKTTHIFDNCVIETCGNEFDSLRGVRLSTERLGGYPSDYVLAFCHACRNELEQGKDIFMHRGDEAFCSQECRNK